MKKTIIGLVLLVVSGLIVQTLSFHATTPFDLWKMFVAIFFAMGALLWLKEAMDETV